ncbi:MAG: hypothetical protein ACM3PY_07490 [Omnitrophica WOR_2 bacterium]
MLITMIRKTKTLPIFILLFVTGLFITGCQNAGSGAAGLQSQPTGMADTGETPHVTVQDQPFNGKSIVVNEVFSIGPGWLSIHDQENGQVGPVIGIAPVADGRNQDVVVQIDPGKVTAVMYAMLHKDQGKIGVYEGPVTDPPFLIDGQMIAPTFNVTMGTAAGEAAPQTTTGMAGMTDNSTMQAPQAGMDMNSTPTLAVSNTMMTSTTGTNISQGGMVEVTAMPGGLNPDITVSNQQVMNGQVKIDRVVSAGPGWVAIFNEQNGQPDTLIGYAHLQNGENMNVVVNVNAGQVTPNLYAFLLVDAGKIGVYEFPGSDALVHVGVRMIQGMFSTVSSQSGASMQGAMATPKTTAVPSPTADIAPVVKVSNQEIRGGTILIDQVISKGPGWIGMHMTNPDGSLGPPIGYARVNDGDNQDVLIHINVNLATETMEAMLHVDSGKIGVLEFPGPDQPFQYKGKMIMTPFNITSGLAGQLVNLNISATQTPHLVDGMGMSLYISAGDVPGKSNCTGNCLDSWLPLLATGRVEAGNGVDINKISIILLPGGLKQVTYGGFPLYYYVKDGSPGETNGQGIDGQWFLSTP